MRLRDKYKRVQRFIPDLAVEIASANDTYDSLSSSSLFSRGVPVSTKA